MNKTHSGILEEEVHEKRKNLLEEWSKKASKKRILHIETARYYSWIHTILTIGIIFTSTCCGGAGFGLGCKYQYVDTIISCINLFIACLSGTQYFCRYDSLGEEHQSISEEFSNLTRTIETVVNSEEITQDKTDTVCENFNSIVTRSPLLPSKILKRHGLDTTLIKEIE